MKRSFLQNSVRRMAFVLAMLLLLGGTPVQAAENTTACKNQQPSMESLSAAAAAGQQCDPVGRISGDAAGTARR